MALAVELVKIWMIASFGILALMASVSILARPVKWIGCQIQKRFGAKAEEWWYGAATVLGIGLLITILLTIDVVCSAGYCW